MTPKEKADELYTHMLECVINPELTVLEMEAMAKHCALIAVNEILQYDIMAKCENQFVIERRIQDYWQQVKYEIQILK